MTNMFNWDWEWFNHVKILILRILRLSETRQCLQMDPSCFHWRKVVNDNVKVNLVWTCRWNPWVAWNVHPFQCSHYPQHITLLISCFCVSPASSAVSPGIDFFLLVWHSIVICLFMVKVPPPPVATRDGRGRPHPLAPPKPATEFTYFFKSDLLTALWCHFMHFLQRKFDHRRLFRLHSLPTLQHCITLKLVAVTFLEVIYTYNLLICLNLSKITNPFVIYNHLVRNFLASIKHTNQSHQDYAIE